MRGKGGNKKGKGASRQRPGKTHAVCGALAQWCKQTALELLSGPATAEWLTGAAEVRVRSQWIEQQCQIQVGETLPQLQKLYESNFAQVQVSSVVALFATWGAVLDEGGGASSPADSGPNPQGVEGAGPITIETMLAKVDCCSGLTFVEQDVPVASVFLETLASHLTGEAHAKLGLALTNMLPAASPVEPQHMNPAAWEHAISAWELAGLGHNLSSSRVEPEPLLKIAVKWEEGRSQYSEFVIRSGDLDQGVQAALAAGSKRFASMVSKDMKTMQDASNALEQWSGGKDEQGSWKSALTEQCTWEDVQREATYYLQRKPQEDPLHKSLDKLFKALETARTELVAADAGLKTMLRLSAGAGSPGAVPEKVDVSQLMATATEVEQKARVTHTESYFYAIVMSTAKDRATRIQNRIEGMALYGVSTQSLQPQLWRKALALQTARR